MKEDILKYLEEFNNISNISIEYAIIEPTMATSGEIQNNLYLVYTPKLNLLLQSYISGSCLDVINETVLNNSISNTHQYLINSFVSKENVSKVPNKELLKDVKSLIISNVARFYNFKVQSSTDLFLSMFLEEKNIIWKTKDFDTFFFSNKEEYKPSKLFVGREVATSLSDILVRIKEITQGYGHQREKLANLYSKLHNIVKLYFIALSYLKTDELSSKLEDNYELILSTLAQAERPWDYIEECYSLLNTEIAKVALQEPTVNEDKNKLKDQAMNFLQFKLYEEMRQYVML